MNTLSSGGLAYSSRRDRVHRAPRLVVNRPPTFKRLDGLEVIDRDIVVAQVVVGCVSIA